MTMMPLLVKKRDPPLFYPYPTPPPPPPPLPHSFLSSSFFYMSATFLLQVNHRIETSPLHHHHTPPFIFFFQSFYFLLQPFY
ncbi:hypothetical protein HanRHA438_Chr05g0233831 [Helianthus annuus]|nr:hypothetical protein HanRHA438_Chr05g0233831 [Helianthus annuus]